MPIATQTMQNSSCISENACVWAQMRCHQYSDINIISNIRSHVQTQFKSTGFKTPKFDQIDCFYHCHPTDTNGWLGSWHYACPDAGRRWANLGSRHNQQTP